MPRQAHSTRWRGPSRAWRGRARAAACAVLLSGCSLGTSGGTGDAPAPSRFSSLFSSAPPETGNPLFNPEDCPSLEIRTGAGTLTVSGKPPQTSAADVRYQLSFGDMARQCFAVGSTLTVKVGVQGRIILGPAGEAGSVDVPLRYAIVSEGGNPRTIFTKFKRLAVDVPPGQTNVVFSDIEDGLSIPIPSREDLTTYVVYIGFDSMGDTPEKKPPPKKPAPKRK